MTNTYNKYTEFTPLYLHDRPIKFIKHMEEGLLKGKAIPKSDISVITPAPSRFLVKSQLDSTGVYDVDLNTPKCECPDFFRTNWPCKHMHGIHILILRSNLEFKPTLSDSRQD